MEKRIRSIFGLLKRTKSQIFFLIFITLLVTSLNKLLEFALFDLNPSVYRAFRKFYELNCISFNQLDLS